MIAQIITLIILFWIPPTIVIVFNALWDLKFWQNSEYDPDKLSNHIMWDFHPSHRRSYITALKVVIFLLIASLLFGFTGSTIPMIGVLAAFILWTTEALLVAEEAAKHHFPKLKVDWRMASIMLIVLYSILLIPIVIVAQILIPAEYNIMFESTIDILGLQMPVFIYISLALSALFGIALDLSTPLLTALGVGVTMPLSWLAKQVNIAKSRAVLDTNRELLVIGISGSYGKSVTKLLLNHILQDEYNVVTTNYTETNVNGVSDLILNRLDRDSKILLLDFNAYKPGEIDLISQLVRPHIAIITGVDQNHVGLFGSIEQTIDAKTEIINHLRPGGTLIVNVEDQYLADLALETNSKEILIAESPSPLTIDRTQNKLESDFYQISTRQLKTGLKLTIKRKSSDLSILLPNYAAKFVHSITAAVAAATEVGISPETIIEKVTSFTEYDPGLELLSGDNDSHLIVNHNNSNIKTFKHLLQLLSEFPEGTRILVTSGIKGLGKHKQKVYNMLLSQIKDSADIVISYDKDLIEALGEDKPEYVFVTHPEDMLYQLRARLEQKDAILIHGDIDRHIVARIRSHES